MKTEFELEFELFFLKNRIRTHIRARIPIFLFCKTEFEFESEFLASTFVGGGGNYDENCGIIVFVLFFNAVLRIRWSKADVERSFPPFFFVDSSKKYVQSKTKCSNYCGNFEKKLSHVIDFVDFRLKNGVFWLPPLFFKIKILILIQQSGNFTLMVKLRQLMLKIDMHPPGTTFLIFC